MHPLPEMVHWHVPIFFFQINPLPQSVHNRPLSSPVEWQYALMGLHPGHCSISEQRGEGICYYNQLSVSSNPLSHGQVNLTSGVRQDAVPQISKR